MNRPAKQALNRAGADTVERSTATAGLWSTAMATVMALLLTASLLALGGCAEKTVRVKTGERVVCTYGEQVSSSVHTIKAPASEAGKYSVRTRTVTCARHTQLEQIYAEAQAAIEKKDLESAKKKLTQIVAVDSSFRSAASQLDEISKGRTPTVDRTGSTGPTSPATAGGSQNPTSSTNANPGGTGNTGGTPKPEGPVASLLIYTPDTLAGYRALPAAADVFAISREYLPRQAGQVVALVIQVEQHRSAGAARQWLSEEVKRRYTHSARNVRIEGRDAYIATDGRRFAIIGWVEGAVSVAIEAEAATKPADVIDELRAVAAAVMR